MPKLQHLQTHTTSPNANEHMIHIGSTQGTVQIEALLHMHLHSCHEAADTWEQLLLRNLGPKAVIQRYTTRTPTVIHRTQQQPQQPKLAAACLILG
jgi:hypothetical protein